MRDPARQESERRSRASSKERVKGKPRFSIDAHHERAFPYFLAAAVSLAVVGACIGDGLHPLVLLFLPVTMAALLRRDYRRPVFFSERVTGRLLAGYVILLSIGVAIAAGRLRLPLSLVYLTTGTIFLCALLPLSDRCITQLIILTVGLVLLNCILTNHVLYALILACYLFALMGALVSFHLARSRPAPWAIAADTGGPAKSPASRGNLGLYLLIILAVTAVTFPFMPRPFTLPPGLKAEMSATTRLRNPNRPLSCSGMTGSGGTRIAFLVRFPGQPPPGPYYWRSRVLVRTDGKNWYPSTTTAPGVARARLNSRKTFTYEISPFGLRSNRVCTLGTPTRALDGEKHRLPVTAQGEVVINNLTFLSESYTVRAIPGSLPVGPGMGLRFLDSGGTTSRIRNLARQWTRGATTRRGKAYMVLSYLGKGYGYTLQIPAIPAGVHSLEYFLFQSRAGNSAHFAGAAVLLLRSVRVPCRMVQGFLGMEKTDVPNEYVVRFSNAHVWVEVLLGDGQWTTFDPSPASARCAPRHRSSTLLDLYDKIQHEWIRLIVNFSRQDQAALFKALKKLIFGGGKLSFSKFPNVRIIAPAALVTAIIGLLVLAFLRWSRSKEQVASAIYLSTMQKMVKQGVLDKVHLWHEENTREIEQKAPQIKESLERFTDDYLETRFGDTSRVSPHELQRRGRELVEKAGLTTEDSRPAFNAPSNRQ